MAPPVGRNDPCLCGYGKKYKWYCGRNFQLPNFLKIFSKVTGQISQFPWQNNSAMLHNFNKLGPVLPMRPTKRIAKD
jgi:hypothetical protein